MNALPAGTITFLFTDIAGSSSRYEQYGEAMHAAVAKHDSLLREAIDRHGGYLFKTWGDAFLVAFDTAPQAVLAALESQIAIQNCPEAELVGRLPVRMALHTGAAEFRNGDYFGDSLNRTDRLLKVANGGQILLSASTCDLLHAGLPEGVRLADLGLHRLRDLQRAERVFELQHPDLPGGFSPLRSLEYLPTNLPQQLTSFIGREREAEQVKLLLSTAPMLTLTGSGGCGKTRLALQVAAEMIDEFPDGVWLVELAPLSDPELVERTICSSLHLPEEQGRSAYCTLTQFLRSRRLLLILDNCEHLIDRAASLAERLLRECHGLRILATSREALSFTGETIWRVPSMTLPQTRRNRIVDPESIGKAEAVRLFLERARSFTQDQPYTGAALAAVGEITLRLDGIPLAIELAAALVNVMPPEQIAANLHDFFRVLTRGSRTAMERHQTLRGAIQWSYDLLSESERKLLRRLSVFRGGWTLEAAQSICAGEDLEEWDVFELMGKLVNKSLAQREDLEGGVARYRMLEAVRQFSLENLNEAGEFEALSEAHCEFYLGLAHEAEPRLQSAEQKSYLDALEREHDNLRAALAWSVGGDARMRLATALHRFWLTRGHFTEGRGWLEGAIAQHSKEKGELYAKAANAAGILCWAQGDFPTAKRHFQEALETARGIGQEALIAGYLNNSAMLECELGEYAHAKGRYQEILEYYRREHDFHKLGAVMNNLAVLLMHLRDYAQARMMLDEALQLYKEIGDQVWIARCETNLAGLALESGDSNKAREHASIAVEHCRELGDNRGLASIFYVLGMVEVADKNFPDAVRRFAAADTIRSRLSVTARALEATEIEGALAECRHSLALDDFNRAWREGASAA